MIKVQPKNYPNDGCHFSFVCETQEEADFLQGNQETITPEQPLPLPPVFYYIYPQIEFCGPPLRLS